MISYLDYMEEVNASHYTYEDDILDILAEYGY